MKPASWKQVLILLFVIAGSYLVFNLAGGSGPFFNCAPPALDSGQRTHSNSYEQDASASASISVSALPAEGRATLKLIKSGGPFPYSRDGIVFNNYEGLLPKKPNGYYHEYTVTTPGSSDRGARRIIAGMNGEYYYTGDHYASFKLIKE
jgi:ribonuclease T1